MCCPGGRLGELVDVACPIYRRTKHCAKLLLAQGADPTLTNDVGRSVTETHADWSEDESVFLGCCCALPLSMLARCKV